MFVIENPTGRLALVLKVERKREGDIPGRYMLEFQDGTILRNAPDYLYHEATKKELEERTSKI